MLYILHEDSTTKIRVSEPISGKPLKNCQIQSGKTRLLTDKNGYCAFPRTNDNSPIKISKGFDSLFLYHYYYDNYINLIQPFNYKLLTDKGIYQPGQLLRAKAIVYTGVNPNFKTTENHPLTIELKDQNGKEIASKTHTSNEFGSAPFELIIPEHGFLQGQCHLYINQQYVASVQIAEYKKPNFEIKLSLNQSNYQYNETLKIKGNVHRFSGIPLQSARVQLKLSEHAYFRRSNVDVIDTLLTTDAQGMFDFSLLLENKSNDRWGKQILIECNVTSPEGETQTFSTSLFVGNEQSELISTIPAQLVTNEVTPFSINFKDTTKAAPKSIQYLLLKKKNDLNPSTYFKEEAEFKSFTSKLIAEKMPHLVYFEKDKKPSYDTVFRKQSTNSGSVQDLIQSLPGEYELKYTWIGTSKDTLSGSCQFITINKDDIGGLTLSAITVKNGTVASVSYPLSVSRKTKALSLHLTTVRKQLTPGAAEQWELKCAPLNGEKKKIELAATLIDSKLEQLAPSNWNLAVYQDNPQATTWYGSSFEALHYFNSLNLDENTQFEIMGDRPMHKRVQAMHMEGQGATLQANIPVSPKENVQLRTNFAETAFFHPQLHSDTSGKFTLKFKLPDALTTWKLKTFVHDESMRYGEFTEEFVAKKLLMVQANTPRFFRQGDTINFTATLDNLTNEALSTVVSLEIFDPLTNTTLNNFCGPLNIFQKNLSPNQTSILSWKLTIPKTDKSYIGYRLKAMNALHTDSEEKIISLLSNRTTVSEALPITLETNGNAEFTLEKLKNNKSSTLTSKALNFSYSSNPIWSVVQSLPYSVQPQVASADQLFSSLFISKLGGKIVNTHPEIEKEIASWTLDNSNQFNSELFKKSDLKTIPIEESPWTNNARSENEQRQQLKQFFDANLRSYNEENLNSQLQQLQQEEGGFVWFPGGKTHPQLTNDIVFFNTVFLEKNGTKISDKTLQYLENYYEKELKPNSITNYRINANDLQWLITKKSHELPASTSSNFLEKCMLQQWSTLPLTEQALACYFFHLNKDQEKVRNIQKALLNIATSRKNIGTYWNQQFNSTTEKIETHALLLFVLNSIGSDSKTIQSIQLNLLQQKRTQLWENNRTTALVSAILLQTTKIAPISTNTEVTIGSTKLPIVSSASKEISQSWYGNSITPELATIQINQKNASPSFGSMVWTYSEETDKVSASKKEGLGLKKEVYLIKNGKESLLTNNSSLTV
ncbi:MAG: hypothetical protein EB100_01855, partial [Crocinitomicaceae bacterium]|nr:hypothetical protein [Crocinitomicaceae bacterium]